MAQDEPFLPDEEREIARERKRFGDLAPGPFPATPAEGDHEERAA